MIITGIVNWRFILDILCFELSLSTIRCCTLTLKFLAFCFFPCRIVKDKNGQSKIDAECTEIAFKKRWYNHKSSFTTESHRNCFHYLYSNYCAYFIFVVTTAMATSFSPSMISHTRFRSLTPSLRVFLCPSNLLGGGLFHVYIRGVQKSNPCESINKFLAC